MIYKRVSKIMLIVYLCLLISSMLMGVDEDVIVMLSFLYFFSVYPIVLGVVAWFQGPTETEEETPVDLEKEFKMDMDIEKDFMSWNPEPWKDNTGNIIMTSMDLKGSYFEFSEKWKEKPMEMRFEYEKSTWGGSKINYKKCLEIKNNQKKRIIYDRLHTLGENTIRLIYYYDNWYYTRAYEEISAENAVILIEATIKQEQEKIRREKEKLRREIANSKDYLEGQSQEPRKRKSIPDDVKNFVWNRDGGRCVKCGSNEKLEFDHIIPFSKGGSDTARNLQLLCEKCNRQKSYRIG